MRIEVADETRAEKDMRVGDGDAGTEAIADGDIVEPFAVCFHRQARDDIDPPRALGSAPRNRVRSGRHGGDLAAEFLFQRLNHARESAIDQRAADRAAPLNTAPFRISQNARNVIQTVEGQPRIR